MTKQEHFDNVVIDERRGYSLNYVKEYEEYDDMPWMTQSLLNLIVNWCDYLKITEIILTNKKLYQFFDDYEGNMDQMISESLKILEKNDYIVVAWDTTGKRWIKLLDKAYEHTISETN